MSKFVDRVVGRTREWEGGEGEEEVREAELVRNPAPSSAAVSRLSSYTTTDPKQDDPRQDDWGQAATPPAADEDVELVTDYAKIGEHVTSVLDAARAAAAKIRNDAREDARRVAGQTRKDAAEALETARREADETSAEAVKLLAEVEKESRETRQQASAYQVEKRQDAEAEASKIVTTAKREASEHTRAAQERRSALDENITLTEERLRQLAGGLRDLAGRLDELLPAQTQVSIPDPTHEADSRSLEASLRPSAAERPSPDRMT